MKKFTLYLSAAMLLGSQAFVANAQEAYDLPYTNNIASQPEFDDLKVLDENSDGTTWRYIEEMGVKAAEYYYNSFYAANDYLVTPYFKVEAGEEYELMFDYYHSNYVNCFEKLAVKFGYEQTKDGLKERIHNMPNLDPNWGDLWRTQSVRFTASETGNGCIGFYIYSDADQGLLRLRNIILRHVSDKDLRVINLFGSDVAYVDETIAHRIEVANTGKSTVSGGTVKLKAYADDTLLGESQIGEIAANESKYIDVQWVPEAEELIEIYATVELEGDTYDGDNTSKNILEINAYQADEDRLYSVGYPNEDGYRPLFAYYPYSHIETIYYAKDFTMHDFEITGMQYVHITPEGTHPMASQVPVSIYMMNTDINEMTGFLPEEDYTLVYDGPIDMSGMESVNTMSVKFDTPLEYTGGNVAVKVVCDKNYEIPLTEWYIVNETDMNLPIRSYCATCDSKDMLDNGIVKPYANTHIPFVRFFYTGGTGVETIGNASQLSIDRYADNLFFNMTCDDVYVYSVAGELVLKASDVDMLSISSLDAGLYIVKGMVNGESVTIKLVK